METVWEASRFGLGGWAMLRNLLKPWEWIILPLVGTWLRPMDYQGAWWGRLDITADNIDR